MSKINTLSTEVSQLAQAQTADMATRGRRLVERAALGDVAGERNRKRENTKFQFGL
jgi:hypothetical protein